MEANILSVQNLSKGYILDESNQNENVFWALSDVSFDLKKGEILGVVGKNGAGKSTLLKILSGIVKPSKGRVFIYGSTASILDTGLGFNEEFSGRENVYLCGYLLGLSKREVKLNYDKIVEFSGIRDFIDMPLKTFSTGMQMRLSIAIALHLNPDILLIDEQLISGDFAFRQTVFEYIRKKIAEGLSAIMVSHSPNDLLNICSSCIILDKGTLKEHGPIGDVLKIYFADSLSQATNTKTPNGTQKLINTSWEGSHAPGTDKIKLRQLEVKPVGIRDFISVSDEFVIKILFHKIGTDYSVQLNIVFFDIFKNALFSTDVFSNAQNENLKDRFFDSEGVLCYEVIIPKHFLHQGEYTFQLRFGTNVETEEFVYTVPNKISIYDDPAEENEVKVGLPIYIRPRLYWKYYAPNSNQP